MLRGLIFSCLNNSFFFHLVKQGLKEGETRGHGDAKSENQYSLAVLVSRHLGVLSECNERARGKTYNSRKDAENAKESVRMGERKNKEPNYFTTKDTKSTKRSRALLIGHLQQSWPQFPVARFDSSSNYILRVLRALRGEFSLVSVPYEPNFPPMCFACYDVTEVIGMKEFSFIIGNCPGSLVEIAEILGNEHVNIEGIAGTTVLEEGVICLVTDDPDKARKVLHGAGVDFEENEALVLDLANHPGQLATLLGRLSREKINVLSCYPSVEKSRIIFTVDQIERTKEILRIP